MSRVLSTFDAPHSTFPRVSPEAVHAILADLERRAKRIATRADGRETWRFRVDDAWPEYDLHFYPHDDTALKRYVGGADAAREFTQLQALQKLLIPATRVIANLKGLRLGERKGDACIVIRDPAAVPLERTLHDAAAWSHRQRLAVLASLIERLESLHRQKLCPVPLTAQVFARRDETTLLADGSATLRGVVDLDRLHELNASTRHVTSATERLRAWKHFRDEPPPRDDRALARYGSRVMAEAARGEGAFGAIEVGNFTGRFLRRMPLTLPWSTASTVDFDRESWIAAIESFDATAGEAIKNDAAARVTAQSLVVAGRTFDVIVKRPTFKPDFRGLYRSYRTSRVMRAWLKTWRLLAMGFACEVPLVVLERRRALRVVEQLMIVERVPGPTLDSIELNTLSPTERERLLYASGRTLRHIERVGFTHYDAKATNWIAWTDAAGRLRPILIDLDGVRFYRWRGVGFARLTRAIQAHPQGSADDLRALEAGYREPR